MAIFTIGYEGLSLDGFLGLLADNEIDTLVDIREYPLSRKPGFSKTILGTTVSLLGIEYMHVQALGCPKEIRNRYRDNGDWNQYKKGFLEYLDTQGKAVSDLADLSLSSNFALLCFEADFNFCHRSMVATAVSKITHEKVVHIQANKVKAGKAAALGLAFA